MTETTLPHMTIEWPQDMPGSGHGTTTTLASGTIGFTACNSCVFVLDLLTGHALASLDLPYTNSCEVRMDISADGNTLYVGCDRVAFAFNAHDLSMIWSMQLVTSGGSGLTSVCAGENYVYFATHGKVYAISARSGQTVFSNALQGRGFHDVNITLSLDRSVVFAGIDGYVVALNALDISQTLWTNDMAGSGHDTVWMEAGLTNAADPNNPDFVVYASCNGYVYKINQTDGSQLAMNDLDGLGQHETRLSFSPQECLLYVGLNGYGLALKGDTLDIHFQQSLPDCGSNAVSVVAGKNNNVYYASNGYAYEYQWNGNPLRQNNFPGLGHHDMNISVCDRDTILLTGMNGYAYGLALPGYPAFENEPWMSNLKTTIGSKMLRQVAMPGTHDSGTYGITMDSETGLDNTGIVKWVLDNVSESITKPVIKDWSVTQGLNFLCQLKSGIRYLDLRLQRTDAGGAAQYNFVHSLVGSGVDELFDQVNDFSNANPDEVLILDFQHTFGFNNDAEKTTFMQLVKTKFGNLLIPESVGTDVTLNQIWAGAGRIIVMMDFSNVGTDPVFWNRAAINNPYQQGGAQSPSDLKNYLDSTLPNTGTTFFVTQGQLTADQNSILNGLIPFTGNPRSLLAFAEETNQQLNGWVNHDWNQSNLNIVICDWFQTTNFIDVVVNLNN